MLADAECHEKYEIALRSCLMLKSCIRHCNKHTICQPTIDTKA